MEKMKQLNYVLGVGKCAVGVGKCIHTDTYFINIYKFKKEVIKVGTDVLNKDIELDYQSFIFIKNMEGLAVLEEMVKKVKKEIKQDLKSI